MANGLSVKLPLTLDEQDGLALNKEYKDLVRQNFLNLLLCCPGERLMIPDFGVGLKRYLFENNNAGLRSELSSKIRSQVSKYLPFIEIMNLSFKTADQDDNIDPNGLSIVITYSIIPLNFVDTLSVATEDDDLVIS